MGGGTVNLGGGHVETGAPLRRNLFAALLRGTIVELEPADALKADLAELGLR